MKKKITAIMLISTMIFSFSSYGLDAGDGNKVSTQESVQKGISLTLDEAVKKGLENNLLLNKVKNQAEIAALVSENAVKNKNDIYDAADQLASAASDIDDGRSQIYDSMDQLDSAQAALDNGMAPDSIPIPNPADGSIIATIPRGADIADFLASHGLDAFVSADQIIAEVQNKLDKNKSQINSALETLDESTQKYISSKSKYDLSLQFAMSSVASKLSTSTISSLEPKPLADLIVKMTDLQDKVTSYSINIYKNKIALQIQNSYYEALKQAKLLEVKEMALQRAQLQYEYADYAYKVGAKSKDDMNLAKMYYDGAQMAYELQKKDYNNAMIELKKNINIPMDSELTLTEEEMSTGTNFELIQGINSGLRARLEIKMAEVQQELYKALIRAVKDSNYSSSDNQYKEAELLLKKAEIELEDTKLQVESSIRMSYETLTSMKKVVQSAENLKKNAEETVEIAKLKYEIGFGADNSLLKSLNLQDVSGTMVEVIAAEENLVSVEEKIIEATNGYNLARAKYLNDIGILPY